MRNDILDKINELLTRHGTTSELTLYKEDAVSILDLLADNVREDRVLLKALRTHVDEGWSANNNHLKESMEDVLAFYGIIEKDGVQPKMVVEKRGTCLIKTQVELENMDDIKGILDK
jgi:hypothetical protein